jgi:hypothetical protein
VTATATVTASDGDCAATPTAATAKSDCDYNHDYDYDYHDDYDDDNHNDDDNNHDTNDNRTPTCITALITRSTKQTKPISSQSRQPASRTPDLLCCRATELLCNTPDTSVQYAARCNFEPVSVLQVCKRAAQKGRFWPLDLAGTNLQHISPAHLLSSFLPATHTIWLC